THPGSGTMRWVFRFQKASNSGAKEDTPRRSSHLLRDIRKAWSSLRPQANSRPKVGEIGDNQEELSRSTQSRANAPWERRRVSSSFSRVLSHRRRQAHMESLLSSPSQAASARARTQLDLLASTSVS